MGLQLATSQATKELGKAIHYPIPFSPGDGVLAITMEIAIALGDIHPLRRNDGMVVSCR